MKNWKDKKPLAHDFLKDKRFQDLEPLSETVHLAAPAMHGGEMKYIEEAFRSGWVTTVGENINAIEGLAAETIGVKNAVALACGTAAIHLAVKLAAEKIYHSQSGSSAPSGRGHSGSLLGRRVFCSDLTFAAGVNPVLYENGEPVFIDAEYETWNMDPQALKRAFDLYPDVRLVILAHLYGTPAKVKEIKEICSEHGALLIEDAAESLGAKVDGQMTGSFGDYGIISFNGNKIITGSSGGMLLCGDGYSADKARKWSAQSREDAPWYEHEELGYNYRISNIAAGIVRGQWEYLSEHIKTKKRIWERYRDGLKDLPVKMNPVSGESNFWLSGILIDKEAVSAAARGSRSAVYQIERGKSSPAEILEALDAFHAEGRPIWKPMHLQPMYAGHGFVTAGGNGSRSAADAAARHEKTDISGDVFERGVCLPSDIKMSASQQETVIDVIRRCFL